MIPTRRTSRNARESSELSSSGHQCYLSVQNPFRNSSPLSPRQRKGLIQRVTMIALQHLKCVNESEVIMLLFCFSFPFRQYQMLSYIQLTIYIKDGLNDTAGSLPPYEEASDNERDHGPSKKTKSQPTARRTLVFKD
ncbi:hypothetical protein VPH35_074806 [Triticum aestivum]